ncbi:C-GCAxxG-C-C family (seleno)protein [Sungkyunkwania multivorans]|uniref:C-GCAxxG-C-C family (Seleno)protein n=1 Tax=Sungkyunkwania multivorans TaxID=1173618 RepID=A0ABW3CTX9_9FLAO
MNDTSINDTKKVFKQCGTCSQTFGHLLNREFGYPKEAEVRALDNLAGGIMNTGHQCGMLWGSALAIGAESYRRNNDLDKATAIAVTATQQIIESFYDRSKTISCREITGCDLNSVFGMMKFMLKITLKGMKNSQCFNLAEQWAPEAIETAKDGLTEKIELNHKPLSCASEVVRKMGGSEEEIAMVAGFAGGLGLSGNACGALSAAIWMKTLAWCREHPGKNPPYFNNPHAKEALKAFEDATDSKFLCTEISGHSFETIDDHSRFIKNGGCSELIEALVHS